MRILFILLSFSCSWAFGQSYYKDLAIKAYEVTITNPEHKITAQIKPVRRQISPASKAYYYWYAANQVNATQGGFSGSLLNGLYSEFYRNKNLKERGEFLNGLKTGEWAAWSANGRLKEQTNWRSGLKKGRFSKYDATGNLIEVGRYRGDQLNGKLTRWVDGDSVIISYYKDGKPYAKKHTFRRVVNKPYSLIKRTFLNRKQDVKRRVKREESNKSDKQ